jgi:hypothetical protein
MIVKYSSRQQARGSTLAGLPYIVFIVKEEYYESKYLR